MVTLLLESRVIFVVFPERLTFEEEEASVKLPESAILVELDVERFLESVTLEERFLESVRLVVFPELETLEEESDILEDVERFLESVRLVVFPELETLEVEEASVKLPESDMREVDEVDVERFLESVTVVEVFPELEILLVEVTLLSV